MTTKAQFSQSQYIKLGFWIKLCEGRHLYSPTNIGCTLVEHLVQIQECGCSTLRLRNSFFVYLFKSHSDDNNNTWYRYKELAALLLGLEMVFQFSHFIQSFFLTEETASERFLFEIRMPFRDSYISTTLVSWPAIKLQHIFRADELSLPMYNKWLCNPRGERSPWAQSKRVLSCRCNMSSTNFIS